ncbi:MAG: magnesium transporter [Acidobacteriota bacterium]|jgi:magnesium transporter
MTPQTSEAVELTTLADDLADAWGMLSLEDRMEGFRLLDPVEAEDFFLGLSARDQEELLLAMPAAERRRWLRLLDPDDAADVIQEADEEHREELLQLLDEGTKREVRALLAYAEDDAGGLMSPRFARLRPDMSVDEAITYLRRQARERVETIYYVYVLDERQRLLGAVSLKQLFTASPAAKVRDVMETDLVTAHEEMDQEALGLLFARHDLLAIPVVNAEGILKGIVTVDDIVDVVQEEATEDIHKLGGTQALDAPYLEVGFGTMVRKRVGWLALLFAGQTLTITAMGHFQDALARAVFLSLFIPLIISSGGNSGSQAATLVVRAMALGEVRLRDWWRVFLRELRSGLSLGLVLGVISIAVVLIHFQWGGEIVEHFGRMALAVALSLVGVVTWGTLAGSMLPFILRRFGMDPAAASAPMVATVSDVAGIMIYFTIASLVL